MKVPFLSSTSSIQARSSWTWPSCQQPRTLSFRRDDEPETPPSGPGDDDDGDPVETVIQGLVRSERLFFEPGFGNTSSILEEAKPTSTADVLPFKESVALSIESRDPFTDFRKSMAEMVEAQGLEHWEGLQELLCWYLKANGKPNHGYILAAFVDLLVQLAIKNSSTGNDCVPSSSPLSFNTCSSSSSFSCSLSSSSEDNSSATTPCVSSLSDQKEIIEDDKL
ncbi:hypothetical protein V6N11_021840 [Hibiscus sabdariffa]|uniref:Transcription repressor n=1 Tax=Hibiscus sabdariffa TaxID=183260 RepID=A0ABR2THS5_9ROSI